MRTRVFPSSMAAVLLILLAVSPAQADQIGIGGWGSFDLRCGKTYTSVPIGLEVSRLGMTTIPDLADGEIVTVTLEPFVQPYTGDPPGKLEIVGPSTTTFTVPIGFRGELVDPFDPNKSFQIKPFFRLRYVPDPAGFEGGIGVIAHLRGDKGYGADAELPSIGMRAPECPVETPAPAVTSTPTKKPAAAKSPVPPSTPTLTATPTGSAASPAASAIAVLALESAAPVASVTNAAAELGPSWPIVGLLGFALGAATAGVVMTLAQGRARRPR